MEAFLSHNQEPRKHIVDVVRQLKGLGHHITISSSRRRCAAAVKTLIKQLDEFDIHYDEIELHDDEKDYKVHGGSCATMPEVIFTTPSDFLVKSTHRLPPSQDISTS